MKYPKPIKQKKIKIIIKDHKIISWNKLYSQNHWSIRSALAEEIHMLVYASIIEQNIKKVKGKVDIHIIAHQKRPIDPDNICSKLYIDGLKGRVIEDDTPEYVGKVTTESVKDKEDWVEIVLS
jgi:hypothetical protein